MDKVLVPILCTADNRNENRYIFLQFEHVILGVNVAFQSVLLHVY